MTSYCLPLLFKKKKKKKKAKHGLLSCRSFTSALRKCVNKEAVLQITRTEGVLVKCLEEVLAASDSHKVITSFTGSKFLRNLHLHNRKALFVMTNL